MENLPKSIIETLCKEVFNQELNIILSNRLKIKNQKLKDIKHICVYIAFKYKLFKNQEELAKFFNYKNRSNVSYIISKIQTIKDKDFNDSLKRAENYVDKLLALSFNGPIRKEYVISTHDFFSELYKFHLLSLANDDSLEQVVVFDLLSFLILKSYHESVTYINITRITPIHQEPMPTNG